MSQEQENQKKRKTVGYIGAFAIHLPVLLLLLLPFLSRQIPAPGQEGVLVSFGTPDAGSTWEKPMDAGPIEETQEEVHEEANPSESVSSQETAAIQEEVTTSDVASEVSANPNASDAPSTNDQPTEATTEALDNHNPIVNPRNDEQPENPAPERVEGAGFNINMSGQNNNPGPAGLEIGVPNADALYGMNGPGEEGIGGDLRGRGISNKPKLTYDKNVEGTVVVELCVNKLGVVTSSKAISSGSTISDQSLRKIAQENAKLYAFDPDPDAPSKTCGSVTYTFKYQD